jgi:hypothetical protein
MESRRKSCLKSPNKENNFNARKSLCKHEHSNLNPYYSKRRKSIRIKKGDTIKADATGFEAIVMKKKQYFKKIKINNKKKHDEALHKIRMEMISKFIIYVLSNIINVISIFNYIFQTYFDTLRDDLAAEASSILLTIELSTSIYFIFEYFLLLFRVKGSYLKHIFSWESLIDFLTTVPSIMTYFFISDLKIIKFSFIRIFRIFRVFRILRIYKSMRIISDESTTKTDADGEIQEVKQTSNPIKLQFFTILIILVCNFFICSGLVLGLQDLIDGAFSKSNLSFFDALYFIIVTCSSTGYGDIIPTHTVSRCFVVLMIFTIIVIISHQMSKLAYLLNKWGQGFLNFTGTGHIIIICDKSINLEIFLKEIKIVNNSQEVIIISHNHEKLPSSDYPWNKVHLMNVGLVDLEVLERANTKDAKCIFIFSSKKVTNTTQNEKVIEFLILKINRYFKHVNIYVQTLYSEKALVNKKANLNITQIGSSEDKKIKEEREVILKYKKIIPILRIKSLMISKNLHNPGFLTFSQNLLFNDTPCPTDLETYDPLMRSYFLGCENKIHIKWFPKFFHKKDFCESMLLIYSKSINEYFTKVVTHDNPDENRPVLLIGVFEKYRNSDPEDGEIKLYPNKYLIKSNTMGIFISYDGNDYLTKFLKKFDNTEIIDKNDSEKIVEEQEQNLNLNLNDMRRRRSAMFEINSSKFLRNKMVKIKSETNILPELVDIIPKEIPKKKSTKICYGKRKTMFTSNLQIKTFEVDTPVKRNSTIKKPEESKSSLCKKTSISQSKPNQPLARNSVSGALNQMRKLSQFFNKDMLKGIQEEDEEKKSKSSSNSESGSSQLNSHSEKSKSNESKSDPESQKTESENYSDEKNNSFIRNSVVLRSSIFKFNDPRKSIKEKDNNEELRSKSYSKSYTNSDSQDYDIYHESSNSNLKSSNSQSISQSQSYSGTSQSNSNTNSNIVEKSKSNSLVKNSRSRIDSDNKDSESYSESDSNSVSISEKKQKNIVTQLNEIISDKIPKTPKKKLSILNKRMSCFAGKLEDSNKILGKVPEDAQTLRTKETNFTLSPKEGPKNFKKNYKNEKEALSPIKPLPASNFDLVGKRHSIAVASMMRQKSSVYENFEVINPSEEIEGSISNRDSLNINKSKNISIIHNKTNNTIQKITKRRNGSNLQVEDSFYNIDSINESDFDNDDYEKRKKEAFFKRKNIIEGGDEMDYENKNTKINMLLFQSLEERNVETLLTRLEVEIVKRYGRLEANEEEHDHNEVFIENRIFDIEKNNISEIISNHILILGHQDNMNTLIKLISFHHTDKDICIMTSHEFDEKIMHKLLKQFKFLIYLKGDVQNPFHLLNAGVHKAFYVIFLVENIFNKTNEDMNKILSFKSIDYFFNTEMCLELWDTKSTRLIGYQPIDIDTKVVQNEFLHPLFLAGRILYMSHLERIIAKSHNYNNVVETWTELLVCGFKSTSSSSGYKSLKGSKARVGYPVIITINVPNSYVGKEYYVLMSDLLSMEQPVMPLGIYIENPISYMSDISHGKVSKFSKVKNVNMKILTSYKKKLQNSLGKKEMGYADNIRILRDISNNDKVVLDYVDIRKPHLPIFITNPPPGFVIDDKCKVMVMYHYSPKIVGLKNFQDLLDGQGDKRLTSKNNKTNPYLNNHVEKQQLVNSQDNFYFYVNSLKERIRKQYNQAFKVIEQMNMEKQEEETQW